EACRSEGAGCVLGQSGAGKSNGRGEILSGDADGKLRGRASFNGRSRGTGGERQRRRSGWCLARFGQLDDGCPTSLFCRDVLDDAPSILAVRVGRDSGEIAPALDGVCPRALLINAGGVHGAGRIAGAVIGIAGGGRLVVTRGGVDEVNVVVGQHGDGARVGIRGTANGARLTHGFGVRVDLVPA